MELEIEYELFDGENIVKKEFRNTFKANIWGINLIK